MAGPRSGLVRANCLWALDGITVASRAPSLLPCEVPSVAKSLPPIQRRGAGDPPRGDGAIPNLVVPDPFHGGGLARPWGLTEAYKPNERQAYAAHS